MDERECLELELLLLENDMERVERQLDAISFRLLEIEEETHSETD